MRHQTLAITCLLLATGCGRDLKAPDVDGCRATYAKLEALGCIELTKQVFAKGCFVEPELRPADCDTSVLEPCVAEIEAFEQQPGGWAEPLDLFLQHNCDPQGPNVFEIPEPDLAALRRAKADADAAKAEADARLAAEQLERARARSTVKALAPKFLDPKHGTLTAAELSEVFAAGIPGIRDCHAAAILANQTIVRQITLVLGLRADGTVSQVTGAPVESIDFYECINTEVESWRFPASGMQVMFELPFELEVAE